MVVVGLVTAVASAFQDNWILAVGMGFFTAGAATNTYRLRRLENQTPPPPAR